MSWASVKGAVYERSCCQRLSLWVSDMKREDIFWRAAMSGGRANLKSRRRRGAKFSAQSGDISAIHPLGHLLLNLFVIECKWYLNLKLSQLVFGRRGHLDKIWGKLMDVCDRSGGCRQPLLFAKQNRQQELVFTNRRGFDILQAGTTSKARLEITTTFHRYGARVFLFRQLLNDSSFARIRRKFPT